MYGKSQEDKTDDRKVWHDVKAKKTTKPNKTTPMAFQNWK